MAPADMVLKSRSAASVPTPEFVKTGVTLPTILGTPPEFGKTKRKSEVFTFWAVTADEIKTKNKKMIFFIMLSKWSSNASHCPICPIETQRKFVCAGIKWRPGM
jgi:hypothetical protein